MNHHYVKDISGCGLSGVINKEGKRIPGSIITKSIANQHDRGNGLGGGFAAYGIYPDYKELYALHIMFDHETAKKKTESYLSEKMAVHHQEKIPIRPTEKVKSHPEPQYFPRNADMLCR